MAILVITALGMASQEAVHPKIAIVIDDFGLNYTKDVPDSDWIKITWPMTYAVMPESPKTREAAAAVRQSGHELIIHFPFDPFLSLELSQEQASPKDLAAVERLMDKAFRQISAPAGINNHRSPLATQNRPLMAAFMERLKKHGGYFLDSWVSPKSAAFEEARKVGIPAARNDFFLDGLQEPKGRRSKDPAVLKEMIERDKTICKRALNLTAAKARRTGSAIAIGHHYYHGTYKCLMEMVPKLQQEGFDFVFASNLLQK